MSGSTEVSVGGETKTLGAGEGMFIAAGKSASLIAKGSDPSTAIHFMLAPAAEGANAAPPASTATKELYRTAAPIPECARKLAKNRRCKSRWRPARLQI
jgi:hypothetical protein